MRIVFMGTPEFAVPCLQRIIDDGHQVVAVYSQPDKPKGRGYKLVPTPVKEKALEYQIEVLQPDSFKDSEVVEKLGSFEPDVIVVVAYGKILPKSVLDIPKLGCINVHGSLLPKYRGAGPIQWSVLNGEKKTGVTTMYMEQGLDTGDMILKYEMDIGKDETASELHDRMCIVGADCLSETLKLIESGTAPREKQDDSQSCYAPMLSKELSLIDFDKDVQLVHNQIRGLSTWPCAHTMLDGKRIKVYGSKIVKKDGENQAPGLIIDNKNFIVACKTGQIQFTQVQYEGSKRMSAQDFLRGKKVEEDTILGE